MSRYEEAKKIGINACIDRLGRDFVTQHRENACSAFDDRDDHASCFVGVSEQPAPKMTNGLKLTSSDRFPYVARCNVAYSDGTITFLECVLPTV